MNLMYLNLAMLGCLLIAINVAVIVLFYPQYLKPVVLEYKRKQKINRMLKRAEYIMQIKE